MGEGRTSGRRPYIQRHVVAYLTRAFTPDPAGWFHPRYGTNFTDRLPKIAEAVCSLAAKSALIDGEAVAVRTDGHSDFAAIPAFSSFARGRRRLVEKKYRAPSVNAELHFAAEGTPSRVGINSESKRWK